MAIFNGPTHFLSSNEMCRSELFSKKEQLLCSTVIYF